MMYHIIQIRIGYEDDCSKYMPHGDQGDYYFPRPWAEGNICRPQKSQ